MYICTGGVTIVLSVLLFLFYLYTQRVGSVANCISSPPHKIQMQLETLGFWTMGERSVNHPELTLREAAYCRLSHNTDMFYPSGQNGRSID